MGNALHQAAFNGHDAAVQMLIGAGVDVNSQDAVWSYKNADIALPFFTLVCVLYVCVKQDGWSPLMSASAQYPSIVQSLLAAGANPNLKNSVIHSTTRQNAGYWSSWIPFFLYHIQKGMSSLFTAAISGQLNSVKRILEVPGVDVNLQDKVWLLLYLNAYLFKILLYLLYIYLRISRTDGRRCFQLPP